MRTMKSNPALDFYRTDAVHSVLGKYAFSTEETKIIQAAIRTANQDQPNMKLIEEADVLLNHISSTRDPLSLAQNEISAQAIAAAQARYTSSKDRSKSGREDRDYKLTLMFLAGMGLIAAITVYISNTY